MWVFLQPHSVTQGQRLKTDLTEVVIQPKEYDTVREEPSNCGVCKKEVTFIDLGMKTAREGSEHSLGIYLNPLNFIL